MAAAAFSPVRWPVALILALASPGSGLAGDLRLSLNGPWQARAGAPDEEPAAVSDAESWLPVTVPSRTWPAGALNDARAVWVRRTIDIPQTLGDCDGVLHWGRVHWGLKAWVNGAAVGESPLTCPHDVVLPAGLLRPGVNRVLLRVGGWASVPRSKGVPLIPSGYPDFGGPRPGAILGDVWLDLYRRAHLDEVLMMPDVANGRVRVRARIGGAMPLSGEATLSARVTPWRAGAVSGETLGEARSGIDLARAPGPFELEVPLRGVKPWSPESPQLCLARVELTALGKLCHSRDVRFGQREFRVVEGRFELNGRRFFMRGENLMWQWFWSDAWFADAAKIRHYLVDFERGMNSKGFRTHTSPPPDSWLDVADEEGMLFLSEFPMILNYGRWHFSEDDWEVYKRNALREARGWVREQYNRPSVVVWVPTNEFREQAEWQNTVLYRAIKELDPTRPILRAGESTPDVVDLHSYSGMWDGADGDFHGSVARAAKNRDSRRPLSNTEYLGSWGRDQQLRLIGRAGQDRESLLSYGEIIAEQTEAMRRQGYDCILPYACSGRSDEANMTLPNYHALRSALAPVAVSIDLFDRNFAAGREVAADVCLMNDTPEPQPVSVECAVTPVNPEFLLNPESARREVWKQSFTAQVPPSAVERKPFRWPLPGTAGKYYLSATLTARGREPVISQRVARVLSPGGAAPAAGEGRLLVLGADDELRRWLNLKGLPFDETVCNGPPQAAAALVWDVSKVRGEQRSLAKDLRQLVEKGGRLVITARGEWDWPELADFQIKKARSSAAFWANEVQPPATIDGETLRRWNGRSGIVSGGSIQGPLAQRGRSLLWVEDPGKPALLEVLQGSGRVLVSQLEFRERLDPGSPAHDPAAERLLEHLLRG